jgi:hypothetical protein
MYYIIYKTTNLITAQEYIGCHITDNLNDGYLGSGKYLKRAVRLYGKENFKKEIIEYCSSREEMADAESAYVTEEYVSRSDTYNLQTGGLSNGILCDDSKKKISASVRQAHIDGVYSKSQRKPNEWNQSSESKQAISAALKERYKLQEHHLKDNTPWNKGKALHYDVWNKGKQTGPMSEDQKTQISNTLKEKYSNEPHHLKGRAPHNKGKKTGKPAWNKGQPAPTGICEYCGLTASKTNIKRWHNDNCKHKNI